MRSKHQAAQFESGQIPMGRGGPKNRKPEMEEIRKQVRVLVVDDSDDTRDTLCDILDLSGYSAKGAADGLLGLEAFRSGKYDIVISDFHMPNMNGPDMIREMKKVVPDIAVIAAFGGSDEEVAIIKQAGACAVLRKPYEIDDIEREIKKALSH